VISNDKELVEKGLRTLAEDILRIKNDEKEQTANIDYVGMYGQIPSFHTLGGLGYLISGESYRNSDIEFRVIKRILETENYREIMKTLGVILHQPLKVVDLGRIIARINFERDIESYVQDALAELFYNNIKWQFFLGLLDVTIPDEHTEIGELRMKRQPPSPFDFDLGNEPEEEYAFPRITLPMMIPQSILHPCNYEYHGFETPDLEVQWWVDEIERDASSIALEMEVKKVITKLGIFKPLRFRVGYWRCKTDGVLLTADIAKRVHSDLENESKTRRVLKPNRSNSYSKKELTRYTSVEDTVFLHIPWKSPIELEGQKRRTRLSIDMYEKSDDSDDLMSLIYSIMGLEALYIDYETKLRLMLSQRTSQLLSCLGLDLDKVFKDVQDAYKIRNKYLHGGLVSKTQIDNLEDLVHRIRDYLRKSIIAWLQQPLSDMTNKEWKTFLRNLDRSVTNSEILREVKRSVKSQTKF